MKKFLAIIAAAAMAATMTACGGEAQQVNGTAAEAESAVHDYTFVAASGDELSGTYTGGWENNLPNCEGSFEDAAGSEKIVGSWSNGIPNGQCRWITKYDTCVYTYNGELFFGVFQGKGELRSEDLNGNLMSVYSGDWKNGCYDGYGEYTTYYTDEDAAKLGYYCTVYKGGFSNFQKNGEGELTKYFADDSFWADCVVYTGQVKDGDFVEPYRYVFYKNNQIVEEGRIRDGTRVSDSDKAFNDALYDGIKGIAGDGFWGDVFDIVAPEFYDRNAE